MKKKSIKLSKKLMLQKNAIIELNTNLQAHLAGGQLAIYTWDAYCNNTWDPQEGCISHPRPGVECV
ncbi:MAG TPA: class I lanthipeptide [Chitinophaga sp.]|uniref:class I lanthipeptide n=1 Tax=Chitinophaga sp. TaxID=1869181 RepID=UPI002CCFD465|nr:class I lanthipeptide [Chitinophaga sp.]HVI44510.1 class I lanthipeptide [Chitinophaga sp.]